MSLRALAAVVTEAVSSCVLMRLRGDGIAMRVSECAQAHTLRFRDRCGESDRGAGEGLAGHDEAGGVIGGSGARWRAMRGAVAVSLMGSDSEIDAGFSGCELRAASSHAFTKSQSFGIGMR